MAKVPSSEPVEVPLPYAGAHNDSALYQQPRGTTPVSINTVPFDSVSKRRRISRRPGFDKFINFQFPGSIQDIITVSVAVGMIQSTGDTYSHGATSTTFMNYDMVQANTSPDVNFTTGTLASNSMGCTDEDGNFYSAHVSTRTITIVKYGTDFALKWATGTAPLLAFTVAGSGNAEIAGIAAFDGTVYVYVISQTTGAITSPGIYRFATAYGTQRETTPWLQPTVLAYAAGVTTTAEITLAYQGIAAGAGVLAVVGSTTLAGGNLVLQQFSTATGALLVQSTLESFSSYPCKVATDRGANFYVLVNLLSGTKKIYKKNSSGATPTGWTDITLAGMLDFCYDPVNFQLGIVGNNLGGGGNAFIRYSATTGGLVSAGYNPFSFTTWNAIAADGLGTNGTFRLRRSVAASNVDLISIGATSTADTSVNPPEWSLITNLGVITDRLWVVCAGLHTAPALTSMQSTRITRFMVVANGSLYSVHQGAGLPGAEASLIKAGFQDSLAPVVFSAVNGTLLIYTDGFTYGTYDFTTGVAGILTATAGTLQGTIIDENGWKARFIVTWRGRTCLSGLLSDPQNWFFSAQENPTDWDDDPVNPSTTQAVFGNNAEAQKVPDIITAMIPHTDNMLIFGGEQSIHRLTGDPANFGRMDLVSDETGIAWGRAFCKDPSGTIYFFGSNGGFWRLGQGDTPQRISNPINSELNLVDLNTHLVRMAWVDQFQGVWIVISPLDSTQPTRHYWWDSASFQTNTYQVVRQVGSWWPAEFANKNHNALAIHVLDSDAPEDRKLLWGGRDGYIRYLADDVISDDGTAIDSLLYIGPVTMDGTKFIVSDMQCTMAQDSDSVTYSILPGECIEAALNASARFTGTFLAGRNHSQAIRSDQHAAFFVLEATNKRHRWSIEHLVMVSRPVGSLPAQRIF